MKDVIKHFITEYKNTKNANLGLMDGVSGLLILMINYEIAFSEKLDINEFVDKLINELETRPLSDASYCSGLIGISFALQYAKNKKVILIDDFFFEDIDKLSFDLFDKYIKETNIDFLYGLTGVLNYLLEAIERKNVLNFLILNFENLYILKPSLLFDKFVPIENVHVYNMGLAHGLTGYLTILTNLYSTIITKTKKISIIKFKTYSETIIEFILSTKYDSSLRKSHLFPSIYQENILRKDANRLAWCYGDLNIGYAFLNFGIKTNNSELKKVGIEILINTINFKSHKETMINDSCFCHGAAGVSYIYNNDCPLKYRSASRMRFTSLILC